MLDFLLVVSVLTNLVLSVGYIMGLRRGNTILTDIRTCGHGYPMAEEVAKTKE